MAALPVDQLCMHSQGGFDDLAATLTRLGIETLGEFAALSRAHVAERFGALGLEARDLVHGREPALRPGVPTELVSEQIELHAEAGAMQLQHALTLLVERLLARRECGGRTLRALTLGARFAEGGSWSAATVLREPTAEAERITLALGHRLPELPEPVTELALSIDAFGPLAQEAETLFGRNPRAQRAAKLEHAMEQARRVSGRPGAVARVMRLDMDSRLPERRAALSPGPVPLARPRAVEPSVDKDGTLLAVPRWRRGLRGGLRGVAQKGTQQTSAATRRSPLADAAVRGRQRQPRLVPVAAERECWEVEDRWWTGRPVRRRYHELVLTDGSNVVLFQDLASGRWFEQRG
ncbi:MAG: hypothetical protein JHC87_01550 [Thermoleophilaceae bacterium]|nr:hypothetical protein [Thermoleophilaceae bacterium]